MVRDCCFMFKVLGFAVILLFLSCGKNQQSEILPPEKMQVVMKEVMLLETYYQSKYGSPSVYGRSLKKAAQKVFDKHQTDSIQYERSFDYYAKNQGELKAMQEKIIEELNRDNK